MYTQGRNGTWVRSMTKIMDLVESEWITLTMSSSYLFRRIDESQHALKCFIHFLCGIF